MVTLTDKEKKVRDILIREAKRKSIITYGDLIKEAHLELDMSNPYHRSLLGNILGDVSEYEHEADRPLLSCVAVSKDYKHSQGFYNLAKYLGYSSNDWPKFAIDELNKAHAFWSKM